MGSPRAQITVSFYRLASVRNEVLLGRRSAAALFLVAGAAAIDLIAWGRRRVSWL